jgi:sigma-B regulation protein RsbU (phosphoserine phosphatase)
MPSRRSSGAEGSATQRRSAEAALDAFAAALREDDAEQLYERAPCGYLSTTPDGLIIKVNQTFLTLTGYDRSDLVGARTFAQLLTGGGRIYHETHYAPLLRMQSSVRGIALDLVLADGSRLPVLVNSVLDRDADGSPVVIRTAVFDATERREYERELLRAKQRAEESEAQARRLARMLQETLIPPAPPHVPDLDVAAAYRPAGSGDEVGGDFYDVFEVGDGEWVFAVGDVRGKGVEAAVVTALARHTLRGAAARTQQASAALEALNSGLLASESSRFCTVVLLRLRCVDGEWRATIACGGHPLPILMRAGAPPQLVGEPGTLLGVIDEPVLTDVEVPLGVGDALLLYTDGVTEGRRGDDFYGETRLASALARSTGSADSLVDGLLTDVLEFQGGHPRDDIAVVALQVPVPR